MKSQALEPVAETRASYWGCEIFTKTVLFSHILTLISAYLFGLVFRLNMFTVLLLKITESTRYVGILIRLLRRRAMVQ